MTRSRSSHIPPLPDRPARGPSPSRTGIERQSVLDPHQRLLFAQRLALLIQRIHPATVVGPTEEISHDD